MVRWLLFSLALLGLCSLCTAYFYHKGPVSSSIRAPCPGKYCGRTALNDSFNSGCGRCPRGWKVQNNTHSLCRECQETPQMYDWFFLSFHALFVVILHWIAIDHTARRRSFTAEVLGLHACALLEVAAAAAATILIYNPWGEFSLVGCRVENLSDWYTYFHNPNPNYEETLYCTQEAVYPLFTMVFTFHALCALLLLTVRPFLSSKLLPQRGRTAVYAALYFLPVLSLIHAIFGGLVYISYPYIVFVLSLISSASHFAFKLDQSPKALILGSVQDARNLVILLGHWMLHAFGILAITQLKEPSFHLALICLVPLPSLFYVATARFTDPTNFSPIVGA